MVVVISGTNGITAPGLTSQDSTGTITLTTSGFATIGGPLTVNDSANITGSLTAGSLSVTGALTAASTSITGALTAASTSITGALTADSAAFTGAVNAGSLVIGGTAVTATAAELNILDGVTATTSELNILSGATVTTAELNILDGATVTTAELNILDGVTATAAELNYNDITTLGTSQASKVVTADANGDVILSEELTVKSYNETYVALSGTTPTVNCEAGNVFALTTSGNTTFTFSNPPSTGTAYGFTLKLTAGGTHTITYPASVDWAGATAPDAPASGETDVLVFFTHDGGTTWYGALSVDAAG